MVVQAYVKGDLRGATRDKAQTTQGWQGRYPQGPGAQEVPRDRGVAIVVSPTQAIREYMLSRGVPIEAAHLFRVMIERTSYSEATVREAASVMCFNGEMTKSMADNRNRVLYAMVKR